MISLQSFKIVMAFAIICHQHCKRLTPAGGLSQRKFWNYNNFMLLNWIVPVLVGWGAGWLVNYFSDVLPATRRLSAPACLQCGAPFSARDFLFFKRCSNGHARPWRNWVVQIVVLILSVYLFAQPPVKIGYWIAMLLLIYFGVVFAIDMEHRLILHPTSIAGSLLALTVGTYTHGLVPALLGGLGGLVIMLLFYLFGVAFAKLRAKRMQAQGLEVDDEEALGQGDVILVTVLGLLVGWPLVWFMIIVSILLGGIVSFLLVVGLLITRRYNSNALMIFIPFGPYFILGAGLIVYFPAVLRALLPG
jgi:prepilin signal peptidase PulO-like enzyme (type II secretory pathway)